MSDPVAEYSVWKEAALVISLLTNCCNLVGFVSTAWAVPTHREYDPDFEGLGLWRYCSHALAVTAECMNTVDLDLPSWFQATQAMMTLGFIAAVGALILLILSECVKKYRYDIRVLFAAIFATFTATILNMIGVIIFGTSLESGESLELPGEDGQTYDVSWSYIICAVAASVSMISGVCLIFELINNRTLRYVKGLDHATADANTALSNAQRMDNSFTPYTSFPVPAEVTATATQNGTVNESAS